MTSRANNKLHIHESQFNKLHIKHKKGYQIKRTQSQHMVEKTQMNQPVSQSNFATFLLITTLWTRLIALTPPTRTLVGLGNPILGQYSCNLTLVMCWGQKGGWSGMVILLWILCTMLSTWIMGLVLEWLIGLNGQGTMWWMILAKLVISLCHSLSREIFGCLQRV